jgi:hypothetical protein
MRIRPTDTWALEMFFGQLAEGGVKGRPCDDVSPGLLRAAYVSHVVFFGARTMAYASFAFFICASCRNCTGSTIAKSRGLPPTR